MAVKYTKIDILQMNKKGELSNTYSPLQNFVNKKELLGDFTSTKLNFDRYTSVDMIVTDEYDGSTNIIINDDNNNPKLINNRFSVLENNTFNIPEHYGNCVTNVYEENSFEKDTQLLKLYDNVPTLDFCGIHEGGSFKVGTYVFYFKLGDADGNMTNIVQESGIVQMHIGAPNTVKIRMGLEDENSFKLVKFSLSGIDAGFDYIRVFYERSSTNASLALIKLYFMINLNFTILNNKCDITLTGEEDILQIDKSELQIEFADISTAKTLTIVDNTLFLGNVSAYELDYQMLLQLAWKVIPKVVTKSVGGVSSNYYLLLDTGMYYNLNNVYYNTGYWPEEFYRFGIVFIYNNNLLSPVFNILGCDLSQLNTSRNPIQTFFLYDGTNYVKREQSPEDGFFNKGNLKLNSKGVIKLPKLELIQCVSNVTTHKALGIEFDMSYLGVKAFDGLSLTPIYETDISKDSKNPTIDILKKLKIKGFFFVRQKRIPTIIAQGMVIGLTGKDYGSLPVLKKSNSLAYVTKSFLNERRQIVEFGSDVDVDNSNVENKALLIPDYDVNESVLNLIFTGQEFILDKVGNCNIENIVDHYYVKSFDPSGSNVVSKVKLTAVPKSSKTITDGENYFSSQAGNANEPYKTEDVNLKWRYTKPLYLTCSTSLVRGIWGSYVGMSTNKFDYGDIVNIRLNIFENEALQLIEYLKRFNDYSLYSSISPRYNISSLDNNKTAIECFRGDCFCNMFTHKMMNNFMDPELPSNTKIVDSNTWVKNYVIRCTGYELKQSVPNLAALPNGFYFPFTAKITGLSVLLAAFSFVLGAYNAFNEVIIDPDPLYEHEICEGFELKNDGYWSSSDATAMLKYPGSFFDGNHIKALSPKRSETDPVGKTIKNIFEADDNWELHGIALINRADVNAVSFALWITFPICSGYNLGLRDIDFSQVLEETSMLKKRSFYPLEEMNSKIHIVESNIINGGAKVSIADLLRPAYLTVPYIKQEYFNRIYWSKPNIAQNFINSYRMIFNNQYREYNKEYGSITKILPLAGNLFVVFQHGIGLLPVNRSPQTEAEKSPFLSSRGVLPELVLTISADYGSMWKDSVILTPTGVIYGVDTVAKKIWQYIPNQGFKFISDHRINKFLNEWINLSEYNFNEYQGHINVKTHYNEFKHDVLFTYYKDVPMTYHKFDDDLNIVENLDKDGNRIWLEVDLSGNLILEDTVDPKSLIDKWESGKTWSLCFNEELQLWTTFYDWYPIESCNVDNIFFSFDKESIDKVYENNFKSNILTPLETIKKLTSYGHVETNVEEMPYIILNKIFIDKAFTNNVKIYPINLDKQILFNPADGISFYYKGEISLDLNGLDINKFTYDFGKDSDWHFVLIPPQI